MKPNQRIPALLMPYLGADLVTYLNKRPFALSEELFIEQCHKLLGQTSRLYGRKVSHGDLRSENILFDGDEMTIIDFDLFGNFQEVAKKYVTSIHKNTVKSWTPPECLILYSRLKPDMDHGHGLWVKNNYINKLYKRSQAYFLSISIDLEKLRKLVKESNDENMTHMAEHNVSMIDVIPYLDNFGLGMALLEVLATLYPTPATPKLIKTRKLLEKITHFEISKRMKPDDAFAEMDEIHKMSGGRRRSTGKTRRTRKTRRARKNRRTLKRV
jgi:serine/threonine protein kinase